MLKIKDNTSKQNLSYQDCNFWDNHIIKDLIFWLKIDYSNEEIAITDDVVKQYNELSNQRKSNASFIRQVKKLNKEGYLDVKDSRI